MTKVLNNTYDFLGYFLVENPLQIFLSERAAKDRPEQIITWPNCVSILRILLGIIMQFLKQNPVWSFAIIFVAAYTDLADGVLAKKFFGQTRYGAVVDPACDKIFVMLYCWANRGNFNPLALYAVVAVEGSLFICQMIALAIAKRKGKRFTEQALKSNIFGKSKVFLECLALLLGSFGTGRTITTGILYLSIFAATLSAIKQYRDNPNPYENLT
jgi:phosphatidylglycerophosphate synthase